MGALRLAVSGGGGSGRPLVLLHGVTRRGIDWEILFPWLSQLGRVMAVDLRGHGASPHADAGYRVIDYVPDVVELIRALGESVVLVGHSLGGMVAAAVAAEIPGSVEGLVLEDPTFDMTGSRIRETGFLDLFEAYRPFVGSELPTSEVARAVGARKVRAGGQGEWVPLETLRDAAALRFIAHCLKRLDPAVLTPILEGRWLEGYDVAGVLSTIRCPTLILQGDFAVGGALPDDYAQDLARPVADVSLIKLSGTGHNIHGTQPLAMMRLVMPFVRSLENG